MERHFVDAEALRDLRESDAVLTGPGHSHDVLAELLGVGSGHGAHPSRPPSGQARSDVTYPYGSPAPAAIASLGASTGNATGGAGSAAGGSRTTRRDRKSTRLNSSHVAISYA